MTTLIRMAMLFIVQEFENLYTASLYSQSHITATHPLTISPFGKKKARHATNITNKQTIAIITTAIHPLAAIAVADASMIVTVVSTTLFAAQAAFLTVSATTQTAVPDTLDVAF